MQHNSYVRVRIPLELKERLKLQGTDISEVVRVALEAVVAGVEPPPVPPIVEETPKKVIQKKPEKKVAKEEGDVCPSFRSWDDHKRGYCLCDKGKK